MLRTHVQCEGCRIYTHTWYDMGIEGFFCPMCYIVWFPELITEIDRIRAEEQEARGE